MPSRTLARLMDGRDAEETFVQQRLEQVCAVYVCMCVVCMYICDFLYVYMLYVCDVRMQPNTCEGVCCVFVYVCMYVCDAEETCLQ
jgi:hypothetical protein